MWRRTIYVAIVILALNLLWQFPAHALESEVVVSLFKAHQPINCYHFCGPCKIIGAGTRSIGAGEYDLTFDNGIFKVRSKTNSSAPPVLIMSPEIQIVSAHPSISLGYRELRHYRGRLTFSAERGQIVCKNTVSLKDYVTSVVGSETRADFPLEALKAQSVLIQTMMMRYRKGDDLNDSTDKQAYLGADYERAAVRDAVQKTWGQSLKFEGHPVPIYFHACCAGGTSTSELFTGKHPNLACDATVACHYCRRSPFWKQTAHTVPKRTYQLKFPEGIPEVISKDKADRPMSVRYTSTATIETGYSFWLRVGQQLGWDKMPGTRFEIKSLPTGDVLLVSTGAGHGVGMCQWGASGMAAKGISYKKILEYYFPGAHVDGN